MSQNTLDPFTRISVPVSGNGVSTPGGRTSGLLDFGFVRDKKPNPKAKITIKPAPKKAPLHTKPTVNSRGIAPNKQKQSIWERCLYVLVNDFLDNRQEILRLNPGRRKEIEVYLHELGGLDSHTPLEVFLTANPTSNHGIAFIRFAWETATLQLFQFLLLKRWADQGRIPKDGLSECSKRVNWLISQYAKSKSSSRFLGRQNWGFLRINRYSWFKSCPKSWGKLFDICAEFNLEQADASFLNSVLLDLKRSEELNHLDGIEHPTQSLAAWELLSHQSQLDEDPRLLNSLHYFGNAESSLVCGLLHGQALTSMTKIMGQDSLNGTSAVASTEFEQYVSEIQLLWNSCREEMPSVQISSVKGMQNEILKDSMKSVVLFGTQYKSLDTETRLFSDLRKKIRENGKFLFVSNNYWTTDNSEPAEALRSEVLKSMAVRAVVDLRYLRNKNPKIALPNCLFLLEKNSSKEYRDSNRPLVIKAVGQAFQPAMMEKIWEFILEGLRDNKAAGEVQTESFGEGFEKVKIEIMSAATLQGQLTASPWTSLAEPAFYQISSKLKRHTFRAGQLGVILKPQRSSNMSQSLQRAVQFIEVPGKALFANVSGKPIPATDSLLTDYDNISQHVFLPDISVAENPAFLAAVINSSPVQFWYRLEWEQLHGIDAKRNRARMGAQMMKLLPIAKLFELGAVATCDRQEGIVIDDLEKYRQAAVKICRNSAWTTEDAIELHRMLIDLEENTQYHVGIAKDYMRYLYPGEEIERWHVPETLPEIDAEQALMVLSHLTQAPIRQHPSIQITPVKNVADFKVTNSKFTRGRGGYSEILLYSGPEVMVRIHGPSLLIRATETGVQKRFGRPWSEVSQRIVFPIDVSLMAKQLKEFVHMTQSAISSALRSIEVSDYIFNRLYSLNCEAPNQGDAQIIRNHLMPRNAAVDIGNRANEDFAFTESPRQEIGLAESTEN